jgi:hypothetical protein
MHNAREGIATALLSIPNRYMHSPNEMVALADLDRAADRAGRGLPRRDGGDRLHRPLTGVSAL